MYHIGVQNCTKQRTAGQTFSKNVQAKKIYEIKYKNQFDEKKLNLRRKMENNQKNS